MCGATVIGWTDLCPGCGGSLEAVSDLSELVGLRSLRTKPRSPRVADQIRATIARHDAERELHRHP